MDKLFFVVRPKPHQARQRACEAINTAPDGYIVTIQPPKRSLASNAKMWAMLSDVSTQVEWHSKRLLPEVWKDLFTACLKRQEVVPNLDGDGFVVCGASTSQMSTREMADLLELISAFGSERGVVWGDLNG